MSFDPTVVRQGNQLKQEAQENPTTFGTENGAAVSVTDKDLKQTRMAGPGGAFAMKLMNDPSFSKQIDGWNDMFASSAPGQQFYGQQQQEETQEQVA